MSECMCSAEGSPEYNNPKEVRIEVRVHSGYTAEVAMDRVSSLLL